MHVITASNCARQAIPEAVLHIGVEMVNEIDSQHGEGRD